MGRVPDVYLRYESAGDQFVGRTVCGLPPLKSAFGLLPPFFTTLNETFDTAMAACFPNLLRT